MRKIVTAVTAAALSLSMLAAAVPALAVSGYDSAYAGESAFVNISPGQTLNFPVFFAHTGTTTWSRGTGTQVDLAACLADRCTCNAQDASEASWNSGWLSTTRYASTVQTTTAPGALGTFSYNIAAPANATNGTYRFNGDLVLSSTGEKIHPEGYYQDATVGNGTGGGSATITSLTPNSGTSSGGTSVVIGGSGFVCTPAFPSVSFGGTNASVTSCGSTSVTAVSPAHAPGAVTVTLTNSGATASNGLTYTFQDTSNPTFTALAVSAGLATVTFSEPVCRTIASTNPSTDWQVNNVSAATTDAVTGDSIPVCTAARDNGVTTATLQLATPMPNGAFVEATLLASAGNTNTRIVDAAGNPASAPQSRQATATAPESTPPTITSVTGAVGSTTITVNFSEPVYCTGFTFDATDITLDDNNAATTDPVATAAGTNLCGTSPTTADTSFSVTLNSALPADRQYTVTLTPEANEIQDIVGNDLASPSSVLFTTGAADFTPPTIVDARMSANGGTSDFTEVGDAFTLTFSETMTDTDNTGSIALQDQDGTTLSLACNGTTTSCIWNTAKNMVTVTLLAATAGTGGTTPGMQIPFNVTTLSGAAFTDTQGNAVNVLGSSDRLVDFE
jgi:hypothetical protein